MNLDIRLLRLLKSQRTALLGTLTAGVFGSLLIIAQSWEVSHLIDRVFLQGASLRQVAAVFGILIVIVLLRFGLIWIGEVSANRVAIGIKTDLRNCLVQKVTSLGPVRARDEQTGELVNTAIAGIESLDAYFSQYLPQLVLAVVVPVSILVFVFPVDFLSGIVLLVTAPVIPVFMLLIGSMAESLIRKQWKTLSRMSAYFLDVLQGLTTLKILGRSREQAAKIAQVSNEFRDRTMNVLRVAFLSALALEMIATISTAIVAVEIGLRLLYGRLEFQPAFFVLLLAPEFYLPLRMLGTRFHAGMAGVAASARIYEIFSQESEFEINSHQTIHSTEIDFEEIRLDKVSCRYPDGRLALEEVDVTVKRGETVALIGHSGSGKSTLANLLLRFIQSETGRISIDEKPIDDIPLHTWWANISWVSQTPYLFNDTVEANLRISKPDATQSELESACRKAFALDFIQALPDGFHTQIGERGTRLSGGQAQRIALARAFLKDAPLVILDEPGAHLDPLLDQHIHTAMRSLLAGKTALMIAHRLSTIKNADRIYVLEKGKVIQSGTHDRLTAIDGAYQNIILSSQQTVRTEPARIGSNSEFVTGQIIRPMSEVLKVDEVSAEGVSPLRRLLAFIRPLRGQVALSVLLGFLTIGTSIGLMGASAYIIAAAALQPSITDLQVAIVGVRFFGISRGVFRYLERLVSHQVTFRLLANLRVWFYNKLEPLAPARLMSYRSGDLLSRLISDIDQLENFYVRALAPAFVGISIALLGAIIAGAFYLPLAFIVLAFMVAAGVGVPWLVRRLAKPVGVRLVQSQAALQSSMVDGIQGMGEILVNNRYSRHTAEIDTISRQLGSYQQVMARLRGLEQGLVVLLTQIGMISVVAATIPEVASGRMNGVYLAVIALIVYASFEGVQGLPQAMQYLESNLEAAQRVIGMVDVQPEVKDPVDSSRMPQDYSVEVRKLSFSYPGVSVPALRNVDLTIPHGQKLAIVGASGAGKTTIANLLLRFWDYEEGCIEIGGIDIRDLPQDELRKHIAMVSQHTYLFNLTIRENLKLCRPDANDKMIIHCAQTAQIHEFIRNLPDGYNTWVGDQGMKLSGGERQRIAIARALLQDAPILILDEPTANLDSVTELELWKTLLGMMSGKTVLVITHRLVAIESMDEVAVLHHGKIVERGPHQQLLHTGILYPDMWDIQHHTLLDR